jgi:hypothetical protein
MNRKRNIVVTYVSPDEERLYGFACDTLTGETYYIPRSLLIAKPELNIGDTHLCSVRPQAHLNRDYRELVRFEVDEALGDGTIEPEGVCGYRGVIAEAEALDLGRTASIQIPAIYWDRAKEAALKRGVRMQDIGREMAHLYWKALDNEG